MLRSKIEEWFYHVELVGLYLLAFFLPILETPKNIALAILFIGAVGWRLTKKDIKWRKPDIFEWLLLILCLISLASTIINWPLPKGLAGFRHTTCLAFIFWVAYRNHHKETQIKSIAWLLIGSTTIAIAWGLWEWLNGYNANFEFPTIREINRAATYLSIITFLLFSIMLDNVSGFSQKARIILGCCVLLFLPCLFVMGNRSAVFGFIVACILFSITFISILGISTVFTAVVISSILLFVDLPQVTNRIKHLVHARINLSRPSLNDLIQNDVVRFEFMLIGYVQATQGEHPLLGIGPYNFASIEMGKLRFKKPFKVASPTEVPRDAHNLLLTKWAEEGLLGLITLTLFLTFIAIAIVRSKPSYDNIEWIWVACFGAFTITVAAGIFSRTLHKEIGWLAMMLMGLGMRRIKET